MHKQTLVLLSTVRCKDSIYMCACGGGGGYLFVPFAGICISSNASLGILQEMVVIVLVSNGQYYGIKCSTGEFK